MNRPALETVVAELLSTFEISSAPIPIEIMLQVPLPDMWNEVNFKALSIGFRIATLPYGPRMSIARLLARHVVFSEWGEKRGLQDSIRNDSDPEGFIATFARMIVMPKVLISAINPTARNAATLSAHFQVPEEDAEIRLQDLVGLL